ncbi:MAG: CBS domain-containing protein [Armatimonadetes bacterium]|nr:CBS domain-containing protein [Armatimonadota bacterium]
MTRKLVTVQETMSVRELARLLVSKMISGVPVVDAEGNLVGVVSTTDLASIMAHPQQHRSKLAEAADRPNYSYTDTGEPIDQRIGGLHEMLTVADVMTRMPLDVSEDTTVKELARRMLDFRVHRIMVTREGKVVGLVTALDLVRVLDELL